MVNNSSESELSSNSFNLLGYKTFKVVYTSCVKISSNFVYWWLHLANVKRQLEQNYLHLKWCYQRFLTDSFWKKEKKEKEDFIWAVTEHLMESYVSNTHVHPCHPLLTMLWFTERFEGMWTEFRIKLTGRHNVGVHLRCSSPPLELFSVTQSKNPPKCLVGLGSNRFTLQIQQHWSAQFFEERLLRISYKESLRKFEFSSIEKALRRPYSGLPIFKGGLQKWWGETFYQVV